MEDVDGVRIAHMDRQGIAVQVLSCVSHIPEELPKEEYLSLYRMMNEEVNEPILAKLNEFSTGGWGWHMETGIEIVRLILSRAFERYPKLNMIVVHWGEFVPIFLSRLDYMLSKEKTGLKRNISEYYKEHIYISPSGIYSNEELKYCMDIMGADHILFSADYPFIEYGNAGEYLANAPVCDAEKKKISYLNAEQLLKI